MRIGRMGAAAAGLLLAGTVGAAAQEASCAGVGAGAGWIGGDAARSDIAAAEAPRELMALILPRQEHVVRFTLGAAAEVRVEAQGRGNGDPLIDLRDESGAILLSDDDSGGGGAARGVVALGPGTYCLSTRSFDGAAMTAFVRIGRTEQEALTAGVDAADGMAAPVCDAATVAAALAEGPIDAAALAGEGVSVTASADADPFWRFSLAAPAAISVTAANSDADPALSLFDATGALLAENDDFDGLDSRIDMRSPLAAGEYCIALRALSDGSLPITVAVAAFDPVAALVGQYDRGEASPPLDGSHPVTDLGTLAGRLRHDARVGDVNSWFSFTLDEGGLLLVEAVTNGQGDPTLAVFDDFGRMVGQNDDFGQGFDSQVTARVQPGTYLIGVREVGSGAEAAVRLLFERFVPAR